MLPPEVTYEGQSPGEPTFRVFHELTPQLEGHERLERFERLPSSLKEAIWGNLRAEIEADR
jgi:hypothetical protein